MSGVKVETRNGGVVVSLPDGFAGRVLLHCSDGRVVKFETNETQRPTEGIWVDLIEGLDKRGASG